MISFKILRNLAPIYITDSLKFYKPTRNLRVGRDSLMIEARNKSNSLSNKMVESWNKLPLNIRRNTDAAIFKRDLKTFYFNEAYNL